MRGIDRRLVRNCRFLASLGMTGIETRGSAVQPAATCANLRTAGCRTCLARQRSYCDCMFIHSSGEVTQAAARRRAMAAEIPPCRYMLRVVDYGQTNVALPS